MSPLDVSHAMPIASVEEFDRWLRERGASEREAIVAIFKKSTGRQIVTFDELLETALCHGWVDTQTKGIDDERYAIRFVPRRPGSNWSPTNREIARRLLQAARMTTAGKAVLPEDLRPGDLAKPPTRHSPDDSLNRILPVRPGQG